MFERAALIHYHEIGLKGRNRSTFENRLRANLEFALRPAADVRVERISSRLLVRIGDGASVEDVLGRCSVLPGIASVSGCFVTARDLGELARAAEAALRDETTRRGPSKVPGTFAVDARRSSTDFSISSAEMNAAIGQHLRDALGLAVDLGTPDVVVRVEVVQGAGYVSARRLPGPGGLPVGTSGRVVALLSAGIDSPVAAARVMRRGAVVIGVHFSGAPQTSDASTRDVHEIAEVLERAGGLARVHAIAFGDLQHEIMSSCPPDLRILLYRRLMVRVAEAVAERERAKALVTGESLGQVASQTLDNIAAVDAAAHLPVLRPLIGTDKQEIVAQARELGTYEISVRPHPDCCTLYLPRTPATHATVAEVEEAERSLDVPAMIAAALAGDRVRDFSCPAYHRPREAPGGTER